MQEVGGSSPPVPTSLRGTLASLAAPAGKPRRLSRRSCEHRERLAKADDNSVDPVSQITITLPDGSRRDVPKGTSVREFASSALPQSVVKKSLAAEVDGKMVDLTYPLDRDVSLKLVTPDGADALKLYRHSTAHLLAAAVTNLYPGTQCGIGPATDEGFYYDFVVSRPFVPEDLEAIETKMRELAQQDVPYEIGRASCRERGKKSGGAGRVKEQ